jgi:hypothetical protein
VSHFSDDTRRRVSEAVRPGDVLLTLGLSRPNRIVEIAADGVWVETERSLAKTGGPALVPAALIEDDWATRTSTGELTSESAGHRGAFTAALFARFPDVEVASTRPRQLRFVGATGERG